MTYKVYQIINGEGKSIGKQQYYSTLGKAKCGAKHIWGHNIFGECKIVELEVTEKILSTVNIICETKQKKRYDGTIFDWTTIKGFSDQKSTQKEEIPQSERIKFN